MSLNLLKVAAALVASAAVSVAMVPEASAQGHWVYRDASGNVTRGAVEHSVARQWNEELLEAIRRDFARPTVHARNLCHSSIAMWDAWAAFDESADQFIHLERMGAVDKKAAREEAISYAVYRILAHRFQTSPGWTQTQARINAKMLALGYDRFYTATDENNPASLGNRIAQTIIAWGLIDGSNEQNGYDNQFYTPVNEPLLPDFPGNPTMTDPDRWQPLSLQFFVDQSGNPIPFGFPPFLSPEWGQVDPFSMTNENLTVQSRDGFDYWLYHDPGPPPYFHGEGANYYRRGFEMVVLWSGHLDSTEPAMIDISPGNLGNSPLPGADDWEDYYNFIEGSDWGEGHKTNPATGMPYVPQDVRLGDYGRILAEFWADGPDSETPPGHWFTIANYVFDHPLFVKRFQGQGPILDDLEWDVKAYFILGGGMHDVAIAAWGVKGWYDYLRPVSAIRYLADLGQRTDPNLPSYNEDGINLIPGKIELVTTDNTMPGEFLEHLAGEEGKIAVFAWRGPDFIENEETDVAGCGWILAENWWPYQRPTFVTPPFAGYVSGHSTYSRAAAEIMTLITGSEFFPGGMGEFFCPQNEFLVFEDGPSTNITLQWATYQDASDQTSLSRIWGGIHPPADDLPGRIMGQAIGPDAFQFAVQYFEGAVPCPGDITSTGANPGQEDYLVPDDYANLSDLLAYINEWSFAFGSPTPFPGTVADMTTTGTNQTSQFYGEPDGNVDLSDLVYFIDQWNQGYFGCN